MKKISFYALVFILLGIISSCKKKEYPTSSTDNSPLFYFSGTVGGVPTTLTAGVSDYYMYSSYAQDANNVYGFIGNLKRTISPAGIQIQINDYKTTAGNGYAQIDTALAVGQYPYFAGTPASLSYNVQFNSSFNKTPNGWFWNFGDGVTLNGIGNPIHTYKRFGKYNACVTITDTSACNSTLCSPNKIATPGDTCTTAIGVTTYSNNTIVFSQSTTGAGGFSYLWDFGDGVTSPLQLPSHTYSSPGQYLVSLRVVDANQDTAYSYFNALTQTSNMCTANYKIVSITSVSNPFAFSNIVITWTDAAGTVYTSNNASQPKNSYFKIISTDIYHNNDNNQTVKKLHIKFNCTVYNGGNSLVINNGDAVIAVAYK